MQYNQAMTAAPDDDTLGLNLVYTDPSSTATNLGLGLGGTTKKPKRKTKYDRRRERGKLAKLAKDDEKRKRRDGISGSTTTQQGNKSVHSTDVGDNSKVDVGGGGSSSLAGIASLLGGSSIKEQKKRKISSQSTNTDNTTPTIKPENTEEKKEKIAADDSDTKPRAQVIAMEEDTKSAANIGREESKLEAAPPSSAQSTSFSPAENAKPTISLAVEDTAASSRRHRTQTTLSDEQQAAYLSEFHARPRDLDRSEHASKDIKASSFSSHLFDTSEGIEENESDMVADEEGQAKDEEGMNGSSTSTLASSCPFAKLGLHPNLVSTLTSPTGNFKLTQPTIVQTKSIAALLPSSKKTKKGKKGKLQQNLFIQSETGSGKTLAYLLPILQHLAVDNTNNNNSLKRIDRKLGGTRCILLCPTRELATQTYTFTSNLCTSSFSWIVPGCFSGGEKRKSEKARLRKGISILIATPGRLLDHLSKTESLLSSLKNKLEWVVLDEADRLLDAGLGGQVEQIIQYLRSNQPGAGVKRDGVTWRSVLVSATVNSDLEQLAKTVLGGNGGWMWARGHANQGGKSSSVELAANALENGHATDENNTSDQIMVESNNDNELDHSAPRQLAQLYMVVSAKLRLSSLIAFLSARAAKGERTVVFMSTCDSVDYHYGLFSAMECILGDDTNKDTNNTGDDDKEKNGGIFGKTCPIYKLHGDIPHNKRLSTLKAFSNDEHSASILLATDVAARGLNFPSLDWIVQYDPPCETKDYVHRAGRSARAGQAGHALLFLLPSERQYVDVLELRGMKEITSLSLSSTLTSAAELCRGISQEGEAKASGNTFSDGRGEAFTFAIQNRLEECVIQNDTEYKASIDKKFKGDPKQRRKQKKEAVGPLLEGARKAFSAFVRAYPAKEKAVRHIFNARALHLGHIARSLALKETPKMVSKVNNSKNSHSIEAGGKSNKARKGGEKRKSRLTFGERQGAEMEGDEVDDEDDAAEQERNLSLLSSAIGKEDSIAAHASKKFKSSSSGGTGGGNVQKRMMEAAMRMQAQEFM